MLYRRGTQHGPIDWVGIRDVYGWGACGYCDPFCGLARDACAAADKGRLIAPFVLRPNTVAEQIDDKTVARKRDCCVNKNLGLHLEFCILARC